MFKSFTIAEGILLIVLGVLALIAPIKASFIVTAVLGVVFLVGGIIGWINNLSRSRGMTGWRVFWRLVVSTLFLVAGWTILDQFSTGAIDAAAQVATLSLAVGIVFLVEGIVAIIASLGHQEVEGWRWGLANGIITLILGLIILSMKAFGLLSVLGILVGISFIFSGIDLIAFASSFHGPDDNDGPQASAA